MRGLQASMIASDRPGHGLVTKQVGVRCVGASEGLRARGFLSSAQRGDVLMRATSRREQTAANANPQGFGPGDNKGGDPTDQARRFLAQVLHHAAAEGKSVAWVAGTVIGQSPEQIKEVRQWAGVTA